MSDEFRSDSDSVIDSDPDYVFGPADDAPVTVTPANDRGTGPLPNDKEPRATGVTNGPRMNRTPYLPATNDAPPLTGAWGFAAAMAGTLLGTVLPTLAGGGQTAKLIGMLVGATASVLVTLAGPLHRLRTSIGVIAAVIAVVFTYVLGQAGEQKAFPPLKEIGREIGIVRPDPTPPPTPTVTPPDDFARIGDVDEVAMTYGPVELSCGTGPDCGQVRLTSVGAQPLEINDITPEGDDSSDFRADEDNRCRNRATLLAKGDECEFAVRFEPAVSDGTFRHTTLVIHQNAGAEQAEIDVSGTAPKLNDVGVANVTCIYRAGPPRELVLAFRIDRSGNTEDSDVNVIASSDDTTLASGTFSPLDDTPDLFVEEPTTGSLPITLALDTPDEKASNDSVSVTATLAADTPSGTNVCPTGA